MNRMQLQEQCLWTPYIKSKAKPQQIVNFKILPTGKSNKAPFKRCQELIIKEKNSLFIYS